ncbi:adenosine monophosphate-protein transferase [candidate division WOR-3 bacterium JGI_Cruoil_03_51_56]|uniref:Adenosine monophosphate-protein transferase n=1 Tax=candidate division WOR-3 bacterium JGI_Cruoil_03_51_56 TaxID=1973747 RepID=A0A235BS65_UNCW3|nr:MAG: adenosine monophosphate-protein transferase [candidate division WOR-3 bacterium JGI_Cruoil_03_51_56]
MELKQIKLEKPEDTNLILGQTHFIKSVEDIYEAMVNAVPGIKFGLAFCEASGPCLIRRTGNDKGLEQLATKNAQALGAGHSFIIIMRNAFPVNVLPRLKMVPEICNIFCASSNPVTVIIAENETGRGILGVIDGEKPKGIEAEKDQENRKAFLRKIGYKQ